MMLFSLASVALLSTIVASQPVDNARYNIEIVFTTPVSDQARASFTTAVNRWQEVITGDIGSTITIQAGQRVCGQAPAAQARVVDDLLIFAAIEPIDGPGRVLGSAGPCGIAANKVRLGSMRFDEADVNNLLAQNRFTATVLHEIGHIIGVGADWGRRGLVSPTAQGTPFRYLGANGAIGQQEIGGTGQPIVEDTGGPGTARAHWKESVYRNELMTGFISGNTQPMSRLTVRSLVDMGYVVDLNKADAFSLTGNPVPPPAATKSPTVAVAATKSPTVPTKSPTLATKSPTSKAPTTPGAPSDARFDIQLQFTTAITPEQQQAFTNAVARWTRVITGDIGSTATVRRGSTFCGQPALQNDLVIDDILIFAGVSPIDGAGRILGQAGPCGFDNGGRIRLGVMQFDSADVAELQRRGTFEATILHEMGHVLGIGTAWEGRNLVSRGNPPFTYEGAAGAQGQLDIGGQGKPIVEDQGGPGTARGHWKESVYQNELMTGFLSGNSQPMSRLTVQALRDIGYTVDLAQADAFTIPSAVGRRLRDLKDKSDIDSHVADMEKDMDLSERELQEIGSEWERGWGGEILFDIPTQDKELTEDGNEKTEWETGFDGEVVDFDASAKVDVPAVVGGVIGGLMAVGAAAAFVIVRRRKNMLNGMGGGSSSGKGGEQMTAHNPMFGNAPQAPNNRQMGMQYQGQYV